ncbi:MAG: DUF3493 domain-containing protein [Mastigocoleus sp.]
MKQENSKNCFTSEQYARLKAEAKAPYKGLRKFMYLAFAASGMLGAFIFTLQLLAQKDISTTLPNLALQLGVVALMIFLWSREKDTKV